MLKNPPHRVARLAYALAPMDQSQTITRSMAGRASSAMEKEAVAELARMFRLAKRISAHLCSGGHHGQSRSPLESPANWLREKKIVASQQAHYTHRRLSEVLEARIRGKCLATAMGDWMSPRSKTLWIKAMLGTVVATLGTTATGFIGSFARDFGIAGPPWFSSACRRRIWRVLRTGQQTSDPKLGAPLIALGEADSIVIDPHKHGPPALWLWLVCFFPRSERRPFFLRTRLALYILHLRGNAPWRDQSRMLAGPARLRSPCGQTQKAAAAGSRRPFLPPWLGQCRAARAGTVLKKLRGG